VVEYASIDEFYLDFTGCEALYGGDLGAMAQGVKDAILKRTQLTCSVAIASNKYVAKIAGKTVKPSSGSKTGWIVVPEGQEQSFLAFLPIERLHGAGEKTQPRLKELGIVRIGDLLAFSLEKLEKSFGSAGSRWLYEATRGLDDSPVAPYHPSKSVGHETTFDQDTADPLQIRQTLAWLSEKSCYRLRRLGKKARTVTLKLRYDDFQTLTRAKTLPATHEETVVLRVAEELFKEAEIRKRRIRLLGVSLSKFEEESEDWLFPEMNHPKKDKLLKSVDAIKRKYGFGKLGMASSREGPAEREKEVGEGSSFQKPLTR
jgi:nucleotidyltransferase/DNA polymerase involved in DNA repair